MNSQDSNKEDYDNSNDPAVVLSICYSGGFLGAAVYYQDCTTIKLLKDIAEDTDYQFVDSLIYQVEPTIILLNKDQDIFYVRHVSQLCGLLQLPEDSCNRTKPSPSEEQLNPKDVGGEKTSKVEKENVDDEDEDDEENFPNVKVHLLSNATFNYEGAKKRITLMFSADCSGDSENALIINFRMDVSNVNMVRALGALLIYMDSARTGVEYESLNKVTPITAMRTLVVDQMMEIDATTYRALEIFSENRKKEVSWKKVISSDGRKASVFSLCNRSRSTLGRNMLRKWFEHPTLNVSVLNERQQAIQYFIQENNTDVVNILSNLLAQTRSLRLILRRMKSSSCSVLHWENLFKTLLALVDIGRCLKENRIELKLMKDHMHFFGDALEEVSAVISTVCDFDESRMENRLVIRRGVDKELEEIKHLYRTLPTILTQVAKEEASRLRAERCSVGYIPMVGYMLQLPKNFPVNLYPDLHVMFCNEVDVNVKSAQMEKLDQDLGDIKMQIVDKETIIMLRLQVLVLKNSNLILGACRGAAVLDAIISLTLTAKHYGWTRPALVQHSIIEALDVNHPLALLVAKDNKFVSNPVKSGGSSSSKVKIFTGPNACGKSVYLKQVGVLAFLAHVGSFVPARRATIGPINKIMTRMYTVDGVLDGMSTFAKDLTQVASALRRGNENSLVIIDEFGKGTMTEVGLSLLVSSLNYWIRKGRDFCPHLYVSSHFHALPELLMEAEDLVSFHTMEVVRRGALLNFKFRLVNGIVDKSFASYTAKQMGIVDHVVRRADEIYELLRSGSSLSDVKAVEEEEKKCDWLAQRVDSFMYEFETWDIDQDTENLLNRLEEIFLLDDETLTAHNYNKFSRETALEKSIPPLDIPSSIAASQSSQQDIDGAQSSGKGIEKAEGERGEQLEAYCDDDNKSLNAIVEDILKFGEQHKDMSHSECSQLSDFLGMKERSILKMPSSRTRGNLSVSFTFDDKLSECPDFTRELFENKENADRAMLEEVGFIIPLVDSESEGSEGQLSLEKEEAIDFSFSNVLSSTPVNNKSNFNQNALRERKVSPINSLCTVKRNRDISVLSVLSEEKSVPLKRLRSC